MMINETINFKVLLTLLIAALLNKSILFFAVGIFIVFDLLTALYAAWYNKEKITSRKLSFTVSKLLLYHVFLISFFLLENVIFNFKSYFDFELINLAALYLCLIEIKSISENIEKVIGINIFKALRKYINRKVELEESKESEESEK